MSNYKVLSNSAVESLYDDREEVERFYREAKHSQFYREGLAKLLTKEIERLVQLEEDGDDPIQNIAMRKALRYLKSLVEIGGYAK